LFETYGTVFKITPSGALTTLHLFDETDGQEPNFILQASDGNFYGTTSGGGEGCGAGGTIFKMTPQGTLITLFSFAYTTGCGGGSGILGNGQSPSDLLQATNGAFYGTAAQGGLAPIPARFSVCWQAWEEPHLQPPILAFRLQRSR
jgi:uncharacterized repeat protein (TIGR03803 family)